MSRKGHVHTKVVPASAISGFIRSAMSGSRRIMVLLLVLFLAIRLAAQQPGIRYTAENKLFTAVLEDISKQYGIRFAYDATAFENAHVSFSVDNVTMESLAKLLSGKYPVRFRKVEGTWMVVRRQESAVAEKTGVPVLPLPAAGVTPARRVSGYVTDALTGDPLAYCNIVTTGQRGTITNQLGYFQLETTDNTLPVYLSHLGYQRLDTILAVQSGMPVRIALQPFVIVMEEVSVTRREKRMLEMGDYSEKIGFNPAQSASLPRVSNDDLLNMLTLIPGVSFLGGSGGGLSVRGGDPSENLVLLDGIPLLETGHMFGNVSALNASFIRQAFVSRGGFDAASGDRVAGLVELTGRTGPMTHPAVDVSANLMNGNVVANLPVARKFSLTGAWRRSYIDRWQNHLSERMLRDSRISASGEYGLEVFPALWYDDINLKASILPSENHLISFAFMQGKDFQLLDYETGEKQVIYRNEVVDGINRGYGFIWSLQSGRWNHSLVAGYSQINQSRRYESGRQVNVDSGNKKPKKNPKANPNPNAGASNRNKYELDNDTNFVREFRADWRSELKTGIFTHQAGAGLVDNYFHYGFLAAQSQSNVPVDSISSRLRQTIGHLFLQQQLEPVRNLKIRYGLRLNYNQAFGQWYFQPRGGIEFTPSEYFRAYYHSGIYRQFLSRIPKIDTFGNADMVWYLPDNSGKGILHSVHHVAGFRLDKSGFLVNAELYSRNTDGRQWLFAETYRRGSVSRVHYVSHFGTERNVGLDLFVQYRHGYFTHQAAWSLADSQERLDGFNDGGWFPSLNHNRHQLQLHEIFTWKGWVLSAGWTFRSGQPRLISAGGNRFDIERLDYFSQADLGLVKTFRTGKFAATAGATLLNLFDRTNIIEVDYLNISTENNNYNLQTNISSMPFMPVFFLRMQLL